MLRIFASVAVLALLSVRASADGKLMIYPASGQSDQQLADDRYACHLQAVEQSGFDPANPPAEISSAPIRVKVPDNPKDGASTKGAVAGAIAGAAIGKNNRDTVGGAIAGALAGAAIGSAIEAKGEAKARDEATAQAKEQAATRAETRADLERRRGQYLGAIQACMEARGYVVR
jgi:hypothetical protein